MLRPEDNVQKKRVLRASESRSWLGEEAAIGKSLAGLILSEGTCEEGELTDLHKCLPAELEEEPWSFVSAPAWSKGDGC